MVDVVENPDALDVTVPSGANIIELSKVTSPIERNVIILLNQPITVPNFKQLWTTYKLRICGDGGANRLFDYFETDSERLKYLPDYIIGDFDSLRDDVKQWYGDNGVGIIAQTTQWATDINKCLDLAQIYYDYKERNEKLDLSTLDTYDSIIKLHELIKSEKIIQILILGAIDGRFDHTIHSITLLFKLAESFPNIKPYYITSTDLIFLIPKGLNYIEYKDSNPPFHGANSGLLPLKGPITLNTKGFKWDVIDWESSMKGPVSSSNRLVGNEGVVIKTNDDFILNIEMRYEKILK